MAIPFGSFAVPDVIDSMVSVTRPKPKTQAKDVWFPIEEKEMYHSCYHRQPESTKLNSYTTTKVALAVCMVRTLGGNKGKSSRLPISSASATVWRTKSVWKPRSYIRNEI